jgi:osmoprotectant transport system substrate-binding protein
VAGSSTTTSAATVASQLVMGGPAECPTRITCLQGLMTIYGLHFKSFKSLDEVGPISVQALATNQVQVVRLDSSDPSILQNHWVILQDDKSFQQAGNIIPIVRTAKATDEVKSLLNKVSDTMTQSDLLALDTAVQVTHTDPADAASAYVKSKNLTATPTPGTKESLTVGSAGFSENETLADIYIDVLKSAGYSVGSKLNLGNREIVEPALEGGSIDVIPEYVGNYLSFLDKTIGSLPLTDSVSKLQGLLTPKNLTALDASNATDSDALIVTQATATKYHLVSISDLGKSA